LLACIVEWDAKTALSLVRTCKSLRDDNGFVRYLVGARLAATSGIERGGHPWDLLPPLRVLPFAVMDNDWLAQFRLACLKRGHLDLVRAVTIGIHNADMLYGVFHFSLQHSVVAWLKPALVDRAIGCDHADLVAHVVECAQRVLRTVECQRVIENILSEAFRCNALQTFARLFAVAKDSIITSHAYMQFIHVVRNGRALAWAEVIAQHKGFAATHLSDDGGSGNLLAHPSVSSSLVGVMTIVRTNGNAHNWTRALRLACLHNWPACIRELLAPNGAVGEDTKTGDMVVRRVSLGYGPFDRDIVLDACLSAVAAIHAVHADRRTPMNLTTLTLLYDFIKREAVARNDATIRTSFTDGAQWIIGTNSMHAAALQLLRSS
jgi:hypothetical protein